MAWILYGPADVLPPYVLGIVTGIASGAAMLPYTVIKEANARNLAGTATGVVNFLNFTFSALLGPVFGRLLLGAAAGAPLAHEHYQAAFRPMLFGIVLAIVLTLLLKETGPAAARRQLVAAGATQFRVKYDGGWFSPFPAQLRAGLPAHAPSAARTPPRRVPPGSRPGRRRSRRARSH